MFHQSESTSHNAAQKAAEQVRVRFWLGLNLGVRVRFWLGLELGLQFWLSDGETCGCIGPITRSPFWLLEQEAEACLHRSYGHEGWIPSSIHALLRRLWRFCHWRRYNLFRGYAEIYLTSKIQIKTNRRHFLWELSEQTTSLENFPNSGSC